MCRMGICSYPKQSSGGVRAQCPLLDTRAMLMGVTLERAHGRLYRTRTIGAPYFGCGVNIAALSCLSKGHYVISEYTDVNNKASSAVSWQVRFNCALWSCRAQRGLY